MANETAGRSTQLSADRWMWNLGYSGGYADGHRDGLLEGAEAFQAWLLAELRDLVQDVRLGLRHDVSPPLEVLAAVIEITTEGKPVWV